MKLKGSIVCERKQYLYKGKKDERSYLVNKGIGKAAKGKLLLNSNEALLLLDLYGVESECFPKTDFSNYIVYRDLHQKGFTFGERKGEKLLVKSYETSPLDLRGRLDVVSADKFFIAVKGDDLYSSHWFGQKGTYKRGDGNLYLLDLFEATYLKERGLLNGKIPNLSKEDEEKYEVFKEWCDNGFVVKTGFKFGGDFRIYAAGAKPGKVQHSKHILHVLPSTYLSSVEEWSRAVRVCHAVKKTYVLALPSTGAKPLPFDFTVAKNNVKYAVKVLNQAQPISAELLEGLLNSALDKGLILLLAIVDREASITYYKTEKLSLGESKWSYYEVEWLKLK